jgi:alcohol dehydrogenase
MKAIYFEAFGGPEVLRYGDFPEPAVSPGWVKLKVRACSLNWIDVASRRGIPGVKRELPGITGGDCVGEAVELGKDVAGVMLGARYLVRPGHVDTTKGIVDILGETRNGALAEYCVVRASQLIALPEVVSDEDASCLPIAYGTARRMVHARGRVKAGEKVLIIGASGGVGNALVLMCKMVGAYVIAAAGTDDKCERLKQLGADETVNYSKVPFDKHIRETTGTLWRGGGVDVVMNNTGGETWAASLRCVKRHGRIVTCGATAGFDPPTDLRYIYSAEMTIIGSVGYEIEDVYVLLGQVAAGRLKPVIDRVVPLSEGIEACRAIEERRFFGKIVVRPDGERAA